MCERPYTRRTHDLQSPHSGVDVDNWTRLNVTSAVNSTRYFHWNNLWYAHVRHFPGTAFSSCFVVCHFSVRQIEPPPSPNTVLRHLDFAFAASRSRCLHFPVLRWPLHDFFRLRLQSAISVATGTKLTIVCYFRNVGLQRHADSILRYAAVSVSKCVYICLPVYRLFVLLSV